MYSFYLSAWPGAVELRSLHQGVGWRVSVEHAIHQGRHGREEQVEQDQDP